MRSWSACLSAMMAFSSWRTSGLGVANDVEAQGVVPRGDGALTDQLVDVVHEGGGLDGVDVGGLGLDDDVEAGRGFPVAVEADLAADALVSAENHLEAKEAAGEFTRSWRARLYWSPLVLRHTST